MFNNKLRDKVDRLDHELSLQYSRIRDLENLVKVLNEKITILSGDKPKQEPKCEEKTQYNYDYFVQYKLCTCDICTLKPPEASKPKQQCNCPGCKECQSCMGISKFLRLACLECKANL